MVDLTIMGAVSRKNDSEMKGNKKVDPPSTVTPPLTPGHDEELAPPKDVMVRKRIEATEDTENETEVGEECIPGSSDSLVSELTFQPPLEQQQQQQQPVQHQQMDPPGATLRLYNTKPDIDAIIRTFTNRTDDTIEPGKNDPPAVTNNQISTPSSYSIGESIVTRVLGIVDMSCVSPFSDSNRDPLIPYSTVTDDKPLWGIPPVATLLDGVEDNFLNNAVMSSSPGLDGPKENEDVVVCVTPDTDVQQSHLQLRILSMASSPVLTSPPRKKKDTKSSDWIQKAFRSPRSDKNKDKNSSKCEAKPTQKVEMILGVTPRVVSEEDNIISFSRTASPIARLFRSISPSTEDDNNEEKKEEENFKSIHPKTAPFIEPVEYQKSLHSPLRGESRGNKLLRARTSKKTGSKSPKVFRSRSSSRKEVKDSTEESSKMYNMVTRGVAGKKIRQALHHINRKDSDSRTASISSTEQQPIPNKAERDTKKQQPMETNKSPRDRSSPSRHLLKVLSVPKTKEVSSNEARNNQEDTETRIVAEYEANSNEGSRLKLRKVLKSIKNPLKGAQLETVMEAKSDEEMSCSTNSLSELRVRVPGIHRGAKDSYLGDKDLIGDEFVEEEIVFTPTNVAGCENVTEENHEITELTKVLPHAGDELMGSETAVNKPLSIVGTVASTGAPDGVSHGENVFRIKEKSSKVIVENSNPVSESRDRLGPWKDFLRISHSAEKTKVIESTGATPVKSESSIVRHQPGPTACLENDSKASEIPKKVKSEVAVADTPGHKPMWKAAVDPKSGRTYYFHRKTRETTWTKPSDRDIVPVKIKNKATKVSSSERNPNQTNAAETPRADSEVKTLEALLLKNKTSRDADPVLLENKLEIARVMPNFVHPSTSTNIERIVTDYEGQEDDRLAQLRNISESKPFDEPMHENANITPDDEKLADDAARLLTRGRSTADSTVAFSHAVGSIQSGYSGHVSSNTRISEKTQQIRNTASSRPGFFAPIQEGKRSHWDATGKQSNVTPVRRRYPVRNSAPIPKNIPVPRSRELTVEEFTTRDPVFGVKETDIRERKARGLMKQVRKVSPTEMANDAATFHSMDPTAYSGDIDEPDNDKDMNSTGPTDSVSALSEADLSFVNRQETLEVTRRRALDEALAQHEWDRAAEICETMRIDYLRSHSREGEVKNKNMSNSSGLGDNRRASLLDRFIGENDWDRVATYISQVRAEEVRAQRARMKQSQAPRKQAEEFESHRSSPTSSGRGAAIRTANRDVTEKAQSTWYINESNLVRNYNAALRRFGALSQLQHKKEEDSQSSSSGSSYSSEEYTRSSVSTDTGEQPVRPQPSRSASAKEFAC